MTVRRNSAMVAPRDLASVEYDINEKSHRQRVGAQRTDCGLSDGYQQNTSFGTK